MEIKSNKSTQNRPEGKRPVDGPAVFIDLQEQTDKLLNEPAWQKKDRNAITVFKSEGTTVLITALHKDAILDSLDIGGLMIVQVIKGAIDFKSEKDEMITISEKQMISVHSNQLLAITAQEDAILLLTVIRDGEGDVF